MKYKIYKLKFMSGVHLGKRALDETEYTICADTIFSALCHEYLKQGEERLKKFVSKVSEGKIMISDAFPYIRDTYYMPKPMLKIESEQKRGDAVLKKAYKKLAYIPANSIGKYLAGELDIQLEGNRFREGIGYTTTKVCAAVRTEMETLPYRVGVHHFKEGSGLYLIVGYETVEEEESLEESLMSLSLTGIGGKRNSGLGRFELKYGEIPADFRQRLESNKGTIYMSLSVCLPKEEEIKQALEGANYLLVKRSGFVSSTDYAEEQMRKQDLYVLKAGACFQHRFKGDIYDVGCGGRHPVYRYALPLFMEVIS